ncbi:MAG TPA: cation-transporting P-type ATPase [Gaiellaceae bacterium]|nr:cation-transporting P-type ATPase [Gaiellaceae bacterium]
MDGRIPHALDPREVARALGADARAGLTSDEARRRLAVFGPNRPRPPRRPPYLRLAARQLLDPLVWLLIAAAAVSVAIGDVGEGLAIAAVVVVNGILGFGQEASAERAITALSQSFTPQARVLRDGGPVELEAQDVVPGDVLVLDAGDRVAADGRVVDAAALETDESALTGESLPVAKGVGAVGVTTPLAERTSMVYAGTAIVRGRGRAIACATGASTALGEIEVLAAEAKAPPTPLARRLGRLAGQMVAAGVGLLVVLTGAMLLQGEPLHAAFLVGVAVAVAAVPEGLAATVTAALAFGARAMARRGALVRRLEAIEALGETTVICTDKTGTLTENRIGVDSLYPAEGVEESTLLAAAVLASSHDAAAGVGDPVDQALVRAAAEHGLDAGRLRRERILVAERPFDSERRRVTNLYEESGTLRAYTKGAPEVVAATAGHDEALLDAATSWAREGLRVLAVAAGEVDDLEDVEHGQRMLGVVAMRDPLRKTARASVTAARAAGIDVLMITGDHPATAHAIGDALGLADEAIVARATPADKLALVTSLQDAGEVVTVTGDGVNDAPALRRADVGVAMGRSGTEAAREASAVVLTDDDFATIVAAVGEGRRIGANIRTFIAFLLSANLGEVVVFAVAILAGIGVPLAVIQVLVVNLITDGLPAVALARDPVDPRTMTRPPRRDARLFDAGEWRDLAFIGALVGATTLTAFLAGTEQTEQTMAFATLALGELALVFALRSPLAAAWRLPRNGWLIASVVASALLVGLLVYLPPAHDLVQTTSLGLVEAATVCALALAPLVVVESAKAALRRRPRRAPRAAHGDRRTRRPAPLPPTPPRSSTPAPHADRSQFRFGGRRTPMGRGDQ